MTVIFTIPGPPKGKARPRIVRRYGKSLAYTPYATQAYEELVRVRYLQEAGGAAMLKGPLEIVITAKFPIPKSASRAQREKMLGWKAFPTKKPDWDNIGKIVCDALNGLAYHDDARVVSAHVRKEYTDGPGEVEVYIAEMEAQ